MKILVDMSLSPEWVDVLQRSGFDAVHWSALGDAGASDRVILEWARAKGHIVFNSQPRPPPTPGCADSKRNCLLLARASALRQRIPSAHAPRFCYDAGPVRQAISLPTGG